ncbi:MAG: cyclic nucleotide-binding domain-containing protein [Nitrospirae bacterium]|nr:cyclic nucleotide-binding domain-containing protein [Nitrospirota bacterium]
MNNISDALARENKLKIMRALSFFAPFSSEELDIIIQTSNWLKFSSGDIIVKEGDNGRSFFIILQGRVCIQKKLGVSTKKTLLCLNRGQCFGEAAVVTGEPRSADAVAELETYLMRIDAEDLDKEEESLQFRSVQFKFYKIFSKILAKRLILTNDLLMKESRF